MPGKPLSPELPQYSRRSLLGLGAGGLVTSAIAAVPSADDADIATADPLVDQWTWAKAQQVVNPRLAYFDTASFAPTTRAALAMEYRAQEALHTDVQDFYATRYTGPAVQALCNRVASWLNCAADEITFTRGASAGLEQVANMLDLQPALSSGDELVMCNQLPLGVQSSWTVWAKQRGLTVKTVMLPSPLQSVAIAVEAFTAALNERSRILLFSHVQHSDGTVLPAHELCRLARERGLFSVVEGDLALGALSISLHELDCDVYSTSFSHWLNAPPHTGVLYVKRESQPRLSFPATNVSELWDVEPSQWPTLIGKLPQDFVQYAPQFQAVPAALALQEGLGRARIEARLRELTLYTRLQLQSSSDIQFLTPTLPGLWASILSLRSARRSGLELARWLRRNDQVMVRGFDQAAGGALRISLHIYNSHDEIDRLVKGLLRGVRS